MTDVLPNNSAPTDAAADFLRQRGAPAEHVTVRPASGVTGAEIGGVDLSKPLSGPELDAIRGALRQWRVVFFRGQHLDHAAHVAFGRQFGALTYAHPHDETPPDGFPEIFTVDAERNARSYGLDDSVRKQLRGSTIGWHTDVTPAVNPPAASILRSHILPEFGGDTQFTNLVAAYEELSEPVKAFVDGLRAEHYYGASVPGWAHRLRGGHLQRFADRSLVAHHPVVRVHPETGEKALFVNPVFTGRILDVSSVESQWILDHLFRHLAQPQFTVRFRWEPGSVAFWDNRATAHLGPTDLAHIDHQRVLYRVTLIGDVPVGPDGRRSELIEGTPFQSQPLFQSTN